MSDPDVKTEEELAAEAQAQAEAEAAALKERHRLAEQDDLFDPQHNPPPGEEPIVPEPGVNE